MRAETDSDPKQSGSSEWISSLSKRLRERLTEESPLQDTTAYLDSDK